MTTPRRLQKLLTRKVKMRRYERDQRSSMAARVPCGKVAYISKAAAKRYIKHHFGLVERAYRCPYCGNWHLTSQRKAQAS